MAAGDAPGEGVCDVEEGAVAIGDARIEGQERRIDFPAFLGALKQVGYDAWVGCEYTPLGRTEDGLPYLD
ncbi:MAG: hypothetical protein ACLGHY_09555, partial [Gammaproteobacteria bacterium]